MKPSAKVRQNFAELWGGQKRAVLVMNELDSLNLNSLFQSFITFSKLTTSIAEKVPGKICFTIANRKLKLALSVVRLSAVS